ncbi:MAG: hypothetical protein NVS4B9_34380 [Ktedonobacteraceae bacterium]
MDILYLVDRLESLVTNSKRIPWVNQIILKEADILNIIDQMRSSIPGEVKQARHIIQERDDILAQAQEEASNVVGQAREEAERTMSREGLLHAAEVRAQEIIRRANEQAQSNIRRAEQHTDQLQLEADSYALETLQNLREHLLGIETVIERTVMSIERGIESLDDQQDTPGTAGTTAAPDEMSLEEPPHPLTRRASLTADPLSGPTFQNQ